MIHRSFWCVGCVAAFGLACTWAPLSAGGEQVQLATAEFVEGCESIGKAHAKTTAKIWIFGRRETKVREELASLARNEAAQMGGTTISPLGPAQDGEQTFGVYVCKGG